jgi:hypothetical protein
MAKWIVYSTPIAGRDAQTKPQPLRFMTDNAAKGFIRDAAAASMVVRVTSAPEVKPAVEMDHGAAIRWAYS